MTFEQELSALFLLVAVASWVPLALPATLSLRTNARFWRKALYVASAYVAAWALPAGIFLVVVMPVVYAYEPLTHLVLSSPEPSLLIKILRAGAQAVVSYWWVVGTFVVPVAAGIAAVPVSLWLRTRMLRASERGVV